MQEIPNKNITLDQLQDMFSNISKKSKWDMNGAMLWGYFFTHREPLLLEKAKEILIEKGYQFVDIYLSDKDDKNAPDMWWLHIEKMESHTPESLDKRNNEFYIFADQFSIDSYDGMDVGPVKK
ncbi:MAG: ribonuclease E inhibitor RraB [Deltaproteobacteria bacterium]|nr:ribonuclease E inhibitor RraB [Deltaproteobacteria bacterium]